MTDVEIKNKIVSLEKEIENLRGFQLRFPEDPNTVRSIENLTVYPIYWNLPNTEPQTAGNFSTFFIADRPYTVVSFMEIHGTAGSDAGAVTLQLERLQGTEAPDSGDTLLSSALSLKATANTVQFGTLVSSDVTILKRGDRLCLKDSGTLTALKDVTIVAYIKPV